MQDANWYYMDRTGERQGPVAASGVVTAWRGGALPGDGLVWREGMPKWLPFDQLRGELGVGPDEGAPTPPPLPGGTPPMYATRRSRGVDRNDIVYAGFGRRFAALVLDKLILAVPFVILVVLAALASGPAEKTPPAQAPFALLLVYPAWFLIAMLYYALQESSAHQGTPGKRAMGIKVTDNEGRRLSFGQAAARWFAATLSYMVFYIGFIMAAFTDRKRALHDMIASTLVVDRWAYTEFPERQQRSTSGGVIVFVVLAVCFVPFIAILAAIAIPAYQDYVIRSQVSEAGTLAEGPKSAVANYYFNRGSYPADNAAAGIPDPGAIHGQYITSIAIDNGVIRVTYGNTANQMIAGHVLAFAPNAQPTSITWSCNSAAGTTIEPKFLPTVCR